MFTTIKKFKYLGCEISYENDNDIQQVAKFTQFREVLTALLKPNSVQKFSSIKYNAMAVPTPLYGSEIWTLRKKSLKKSGIIRV